MELTSRLTLKERLDARQVVVAVADGVILERVRRVVGPGIPVIATLDLHANVSQRMVDAASMRPLSRTRFGSGIRFACAECYKRVMALRKAAPGARSR